MTQVPLRKCSNPKCASHKPETVLPAVKLVSPNACGVCGAPLEKPPVSFIEQESDKALWKIKRYE